MVYSNLLHVNQSTNLEGSVEPDIPEHSLVELELAMENLKKQKAPRVDHIPSKLILAGGDKL